MFICFLLFGSLLAYWGQFADPYPRHLTGVKPIRPEDLRHGPLNVSSTILNHEHQAPLDDWLIFATVAVHSSLDARVTCDLHCVSPVPISSSTYISSLHPI